MMAKYCELFTTFFKVGTFTIGGGYAMIPLIQREVVERRRWLSDTEMLDVIALSQTMPGILAANIAALVGQRLRGTRGALVAVAGNILMPIVFIILIPVVDFLLRAFLPKKNSQQHANDSTAKVAFPRDVLWYSQRGNHTPDEATI